MRHQHKPGARRLCVALFGVALCVVALSLAPGCSGGSPEKKRAVRAPVAPRDIPSALRGIIASQATITGLEPTRISGLGFVVGVNGTGGGTLNDRVMFHMERELGLKGVGSGAFDGTPFEGMSPRRILQSKETAVVVVEALVPPGAPEGARFDVFVTALNSTSLEGGRLYTTELRVGPAMAFGGPQTTKVAEAHGNIFINPFAEPGETDSVVTRTSGRILNGGVVTDSRKVRILLDNPSHSRVRQIVSAINSRFPERPGDAGPIARGRNDREIEVDVPKAYLDNSGEFVQVLAHVQVDQSMPQVYAKRYVDALRAEPYLADDLAWSLHALGEPALPFLRELYDDPELLPRLAALRTGARLGDARVAPHLIELAESGADATRTDAIELLGRVDAGPKVDQALKELLSERSMPIRVAAYGALAKRAERSQFRSLVQYEQYRDAPIGMRPSAVELKREAAASLPAGTIFAVSRVPMYNKFFLDRVPAGDPMIYVTQQGIPRIVLFGESLDISAPAFVDAWSDRLMVVSDSESEDPRLMYRAVPGRAVRLDVAQYSPTYQTTLDRSVPDLIDFLSREWTPEQPMVGLGLTYSETVGALHEMYKAGAINAAFATERDKLLADLLASIKGQEVEVRPETPSDKAELVVFDKPELTPQKPTGERPAGLLEPIEPKTTDKKKK